MNGASLRLTAFVLILLTVAIAIAGDWSSGQSLAGLWKLPAVLLLSGLAYESWIVSRSRWSFELQAPERVFLGRGSSFRFVGTHALNRTLQSSRPNSSTSRRKSNAWWCEQGSMPPLSGG
jgi:hypothetical protein